jgi:hypothetical protein
VEKRLEMQNGAYLSCSYIKFDDFCFAQGKDKLFLLQEGRDAGLAAIQGDSELDWVG